MTKTSEKAKPFVITRSFDAPRELVYAAWTDPEHLKQWMGPAGFKTEYKRCEMKVGGVAHYSMTSPDGMQMWGRAIYRELTKPSKLAYVQAFSNENEGPGKHPMVPVWPDNMLTEVVFEEQGKKTLITLTWTPIDPTPEEAAIFNSFHESMNGGWGGSFGQLDAYLAKRATK